MTLEEAQARILELEEQVTTLTSERDNVQQNLTETERTLQEVRDLNHKYFLRLSNNPTPAPDDGKEDTPTLEEFALTLKI